MHLAFRSSRADCGYPMTKRQVRLADQGARRGQKLHVNDTNAEEPRIVREAEIQRDIAMRSLYLQVSTTFLRTK